MRTMLGALGAVLLVSAATSCSLVGGSTSPRCGRGLRRFYLTRTTVAGNQTLTACAAGFHMASRFELLNVSVLDYDTDLGVTTDDSGAGAPSAAAQYGASAPSGWMRTGGGSQFSDAAHAPGSAFTNCGAWSSASPEAYGTAGWLTDRFTASDGATPWSGGSEACDVPHHVWCVENYPARSPGPAGTGEEPHRHGRRGRDDIVE